MSALAQIRAADVTSADLAERRARPRFAAASASLAVIATRLFSQTIHGAGMSSGSLDKTTRLTALFAG